MRVASGGGGRTSTERTGSKSSKSARNHHGKPLLSSLRVFALHECLHSRSRRVSHFRWVSQFHSTHPETIPSPIFEHFVIFNHIATTLLHGHSIRTFRKIQRVQQFPRQRHDHLSDHKCGKQAHMRENHQITSKYVFSDYLPSS